MKEKLTQFNGLLSTATIIASTVWFVMGHTDNAILFLIWSLKLNKK